MLKKIGLGFLVLIGAVAGYAAVQKPDYVYFREITINASPEQIFPLINTSRAAEKWMPWNEIDPQVRMSYSGPEEGVGARASWDSKGKMGAGSSTISGVTPNRSVQFDLETLKPCAMKQKAELSITPAGAQSLVRWSVSGTNGFVGRLIGVFLNMDKMVGGMFEKGLFKLKILAEGGTV